MFHFLLSCSSEETETDTLLVGIVDNLNFLGSFMVGILDNFDFLADSLLVGILDNFLKRSCPVFQPLVYLDFIVEMF